MVRWQQEEGHPLCKNPVLLTHSGSLPEEEDSRGNRLIRLHPEKCLLNGSRLLQSIAVGPVFDGRNLSSKCLLGDVKTDGPRFFFLCGDDGELSFLLMTGASALALSRARWRWNVMKFHMIHAWMRNTPARQLTLQTGMQSQSPPQLLPCLLWSPVSGWTWLASPSQFSSSTFSRRKSWGISGTGFLQAGKPFLSRKNQ